MIARRPVLTTLGLLAASALLLTGCAGGVQSKADACKSLEPAVKGAASSLSAAFEKITDDPSLAEKALNAFGVKLTAAVAKVTNPTVKAEGKAAVSSLNALDSDLKKYVADQTNSDAVNAMQSDATKFQTTLNKLGSTCEAA